LPPAYPDLAGFLSSRDPFRTLTPESIAELASLMEIIETAPDAVLVRQGEPNDDMYVIVSGKLRARFFDTRGAERTGYDLGPGGTFGEMGILAGNTAPATIEAAGPALVARLPRHAFERFSAANPQAALQLTQALSRNLREQRLMAAVHSTDIFRGLDQAFLDDLDSELELLTLHGGEIVFRQGEPGDYMCVIITGRVRVTVGAGGNEHVVAELGAGETVGEMALVTGEPRSANVYAIRDTQLAKLHKSSVDKFLTSHPQATVQILTRPLVTHLKEMNAGLAREENIATIAVIAAGPGGVASRMAAALERSLARFGPTLRLNAAKVDQSLGRKGIAQTTEREGGAIRLVEWLGGLEREHLFVIYEADEELTPWTRRCLRQGDRILIAADATGDPTLSEIESEIERSSSRNGGMRQTLALVHPSGDRMPTGTAKWLAPRKVDRHLHVRLDRTEDVDRLANFLTGRTVGLTLGGGFARGLAHAGVFRALRDMGIPVDAVGGASMGAILAAQYALGWEQQRIIDDTCKGCSESFNDLTFPFVAFKRGNKFSELIRGFFGDYQIEDLWTPYFCVSANLNRAELKVHTQGSLAKAVLASTRAAAIFPPIVFDGELHVDGGVLNNVPVDIMKTHCNGGFVIGVDVSPPHELIRIDDYGDGVDGWRAFCRRFIAKKPVYIPSILLIIMRTLEFGGIAYKNSRRKMADVYLTPNLLPFKRTDFHSADQIAEVGYRVATDDVGAWRNSSAKLAARRPDLVIRDVEPLRTQTAGGAAS